jgi:TRAP-type mannitol/chloroaromatic compound transport system permease small subunit
MERWIRLAERIDGLSRGLGRLAAWLGLAMVMIGAFNAVARYGGRFVGLNLSSNAWIELQWYLFSAVFLLGAAATLEANAHVRVDVLYGRLGERARAAIDLAGTALFLIPFCIFGILVSWPAVAASWSILEMSPDPGGLPRYPIKSLIPLAFALLILQGIAGAVRSIDRLRRDS